jgi:hypothetical protein
MGQGRRMHIQEETTKCNEPRVRKAIRMHQDPRRRRRHSQQWGTASKVEHSIAEGCVRPGNIHPAALASNSAKDWHTCVTLTLHTSHAQFPVGTSTDLRVKERERAGVARGGRGAQTSQRLLAQNCERDADVPGFERYFSCRAERQLRHVSGTRRQRRLGEGPPQCRPRAPGGHLLQY